MSTAAEAHASLIREGMRVAEANRKGEPLPVKVPPNALPGHCSGCGAPVLLVNLRWVDRDVPTVHDCARAPSPTD